MAQKHASLQQHATSRKTRSSNSINNSTTQRKRASLQPASQDSSNDLNQGRQDYVAPTSSKTVKTKAADSGSDGDSTDGDGEDDSNGQDEDDEEEPESFAPSEPSKRHGHQTGLSISLSNATLEPDANARKRVLDVESDEDESPSRPRKTSRWLPSAGIAVIIEDDDSYDAVDLISESDDEDDIEREEEKVIIDSEEERSKTKTDKRHRSRSASAEFWGGFSPDAAPEDAPFFDEHFGRTEHYSEFELYSPSQLDDEKALPEAQNSQKRRVRFAEDIPRSSSSSFTSTTSEVDTNLFPDLFLQQDKLDPAFRQMIENDDGGEKSMSDGEGSYWDLDHNDDFELEKHGLEDESSGSEGSSSGYESDMGETTDEEVLPPATVNRPQSLLRLNPISSQIRAAPTPVSTLVRRPLTTGSSRPRGPSMGSWIADPTKPIAVIDKTGKHIIFYPAKRPVHQVTTQASSNSSTLNSPTTTSFARLAGALDESENDRSDGTSHGLPSTLLPGTDFMMSGLFNDMTGTGPINPGQVTGQPQAFYSLGNFDQYGNYQDDEDEDYSDDDYENELNMDDFIDFGDATSDSEAVASDDNDDAASLVDQTTSQTPTQALTRTEPRKELHKSPSSDLLEHFDRGVVSSFRRNQNRHQNLLRCPLVNTSLYAIKGGRHTAMNNPISPLRKRKVGQTFGGSLSAFAGMAAAKRRIKYPGQKRKKVGR